MNMPQARVVDAADGSAQAALAALLQRFGSRLQRSAAVRDACGRDESYHAGAAPDAVLRVRDSAEVVELVRICAAHRFPVIPYGAGTSLEGHVAALHGGVCVDLREMNRVLAVRAEDMDVTVEPGVTRKQLNQYLRDTGLFFPVDPGADASLGGMAATRAAGTTTVRYGAMRDNVLSLDVVLADGRLIRTARRARKSAAGYDLTRLFTGSEGTLGVITGLTLRVYGIPEAIAAAVCPFPSVDDAVNTVICTIQSGIPVARMELLDALQMEATNRYSGRDEPQTPTLFLEFHGSPAAVEEQAGAVQAIAAEYHGSDFRWVLGDEQRNALWQARHDAAYAGKALRPGGQLWATDVCVPISRLAECIRETQADLAGSGLIAPVLGHVGDGNFHLTIVLDPENAGERARAAALHRRMVERALAMDGTCTGEHGVGHGKLAFMEAEHGEALTVMASIKRALDPGNIMNPGKVVAVAR